MDPRSELHERFIQRSTTAELIALLGTFADELRLRGSLAVDRPDRARLLLAACARVVEARTLLRQADVPAALRPLVAAVHPSAAPPPDSQHGAVEPEPGPTLRRGRLSAPGTNGGAAESLTPQQMDELAGYPLDHGLMERVRRSPLSREALTAESRGQRDPKGGEAVAEGDRAEKGPGSLADHLAAVKSAGGSR